MPDAHKAGMRRSAHMHGERFSACWTVPRHAGEQPHAHQPSQTLLPRRACHCKVEVVHAAEPDHHVQDATAARSRKQLAERSPTVAAACRRYRRRSPASWPSASNLRTIGGRPHFKLIFQWNEGAVRGLRLSGSRLSVPRQKLPAAATAVITVDGSECSGTASTTSC